MKHIHLENNKILGYYSEDINPIIPSGCLEITEKQWREALSINANCYENGKFIIKDFRTDNEKEKARIENINSYTQSFIYSKYSQPKQSSANLGVYDEAYKNEMVAFIKRIVDLSNESIENNTSFEDYKAMLNE